MNRQYFVLRQITKDLLVDLQEHQYCQFSHFTAYFLALCACIKQYN
jgi:hypothetical protein